MQKSRLPQQQNSSLRSSALSTFLIALLLKRAILLLFSPAKMFAERI